eukprot:4875681-Pleurochrysis_carterae.AAC.1
MDSRGSGHWLPRRSRSSSRSPGVAADRASASATSGGHTCETTHGSRGASATKAYPPTPSTPLASDVARIVPLSSGARK